MAFSVSESGSRRLVLALAMEQLETIGSLRIRIPFYVFYAFCVANWIGDRGPSFARSARYAFTTWPGAVFSVAMALRVSMMQGAQSASS